MCLQGQESRLIGGIGGRYHHFLIDFYLNGRSLDGDVHRKPLPIPGRMAGGGMAVVEAAGRIAGVVMIDLGFVPNGPGAKIPRRMSGAEKDTAIGLGAGADV